MSRYIIKAVCPNGHVQQIAFDGFTRADVERTAGLMDGSSELYVFPPGPDSLIGKCASCGESFFCEVIESEAACDPN